MVGCGERSGAYGRSRVPISDVERRLLLEKRKREGLSLVCVAEILGVHWTTLRKWENGETSLISRSSSARLREFLSCEVVSGRSVQHSDSVDLSPADSSDSRLDVLIRRLTTLMKLCRGRQALRDRLLGEMERLVDDGLASLSKGD